jgi:hypothetical protein
VLLFEFTYMHHCAPFICSPENLTMWNVEKDRSKLATLKGSAIRMY